MKPSDRGFVYIMTNVHHTVFYTGVTSDLASRVFDHRERVDTRSFTFRYNVVVLAYYEEYPGIEQAIAREKEIKKYSRKKKIALIEEMNPEWKDLYNEISA